MSRYEPSFVPVSSATNRKACVCLLGPGGVVTKTWYVTDKPVSFGRGDTADVIIDDDSLSRNHFLVTNEGAGFILIDLESQNGTWVRGECVTAHKLRHGDVIRAGGSLFCFTNLTSAVPGAIRVPLPAKAVQPGPGALAQA